jgi:hypothetical protein
MWHANSFPYAGGPGPELLLMPSLAAADNYLGYRHE